MLDELRLKNFKSYKDTLIKFDIITTFIGDNRQGKSSANIYPLEILLLNGNFSEDFIHYGSEEAELTVTFENTKVKRTRNSMGTTLSFTDEHGKTTTYNGKKGIDSEVQKYTGIVKVDIDEAKQPENINFFFRSSPSFILNRSNELVRRRLSGILMLNPLETTKVQLANQYSKNSNDLNLTLEKIQSTEKDIDLLEKSITVLEEILDLNNLRDLIQNYIKQVTIVTPDLTSVKQDLLLIQYSLCKPVVVPDLAIDLKPLELISEYLANQENLGKIQLSFYNLENDIRKLKDEINLIPICPTCQQPILPT